MTTAEPHDLVALLRDRSRPMSPLPTETEPRLRDLPGIRAVLFDVYGTLVTSGSGDVGTAAATGRGTSFVEALAAVGLRYEGDGDVGVRTLIDTIRSHHDANEAAEFPEVEIVRVWQQVLHAEQVRGAIAESVDLDEPTLDRLAIEYETRVNPVWPMPAARATIDAIRVSGRLLGIVSNAQFFTPLLFPALFGAELADLGFDLAACVYSFRFLQAKPGRFLYDRAAEALAARGIAPAETLYVGNDLLNDVVPAVGLGFRTALLAGDARSLRWREGDPRVDGVEPDIVLTRLEQLSDVLI